MVIQLRKHRDSKSAVTASALTAASDSLRWEIVRNSLQSVDESVLSGGSDYKDKASLCCLVRPQEQVINPQTMHSAMVLLAELYKEFLHRIELTIQAEESCSGEKRETDSQDYIVREILLDTMRQIGKKVCRVGARAFKQALAPAPAQRSNSALGFGEKGRCTDQSQPTNAAKVDGPLHRGTDSDRSWETLYSAEDLRYFKAVTAADIVHDLAAAYL